MKKETMFSILRDVNEKFYSKNVENMPKKYFDTLHSIIVGVFADFTEEEFNHVPSPLCFVVDSLYNDILECCSEEYQNQLKEYIDKNGRFYQKTTQKTTKCKQTIGFVVEVDEGLNI